MDSRSAKSSMAGRLFLWLVIGCMLLDQSDLFSQEATKDGESGASADSRLDCPPEAKVDEAVELIRAAYETAYTTAKESEEPNSLIEQLVGLSNQTTDPAKKYALLLEAEIVATQYENYATALDLLAKRAEQFQIDGLKLKGELLKRLAGPKVAADLVLLDQAGDTAEQAMQEERFDVAAEAASLAISVAKAIEREQKAAEKRDRLASRPAKGDPMPPPLGPGLVKKGTALQARVTAAQKVFTEYGEALVQIQAKPDDAAANAAIARYLCFVRGEWQKGLPALAKSDLESLKGIAAEEMALLSAEKQDVKQRFELAGKWWSAAESKGLTLDHQSAVKDHAAAFYAGVAETLADVLEKQLATSRLRGLTARPDKAATEKVVYLSDMPEVEAKVVHFGLGKGTITGKKKPIRSIVDGKESPHGLAMHPGDGPQGDCFVKYELPKGARRFVATTTLDENGSFAHCGIGFEVIADGKSVWKSKTINKDNQFDKCDIAIEDCRNLELRTYTVTKAFGGHAVWIEPCLTFGESEQPAKASRPTDAIVWETNGHAYKVFPVKESISWTDAQQRCVDMGGSLACGESEEEFAFLYKLKGGVRVWLGGREVNGKWLWTTGKPAPIPAGKGGDNKFLATTRGTGRIAQPDLADFVEGFICEWPCPQVPSEVK